MERLQYYVIYVEQEARTFKLGSSSTNCGGFVGQDVMIGRRIYFRSQSVECRALERQEESLSGGRKRIKFRELITTVYGAIYFLVNKKLAAASQLCIYETFWGRMCRPHRFEDESSDER